LTGSTCRCRILSEKGGYWGAEWEFFSNGGIVGIFNKIKDNLVKKSGFGS
jgi:hypothetical protein